jgi:CheY-like chemotaxis protein
MASRTGTILIVDDEPDVLEILGEQLALSGYVVVHASDGIDALSCLYATPPTLVLLDVAMPRMNGIDVIAQIRNERRLRDIPVLAMSGRDELLHKALAAGATDVLRKPLDREVLLQTLSRHLG